ncbi:MAG: hypothetical protein EBT03_11935 [Betaproteobacteria bacterium]|nr:hypothetical protein [Betaproteobacteria bacterium]NCA17725.1 hypothetical protein [Betaproteobacteria bacterium]
MQLNEFDDWYYRELDRAIRTPKRRGQVSRLMDRISLRSVYKGCTSLYAHLGRGSARSPANAGTSPQALCRTRTGDPFLTMQRGTVRLRRLVALFLGVFWLLVGLAILYIFHGLNV